MHHSSIAPLKQLKIIANSLNDAGIMASVYSRSTLRAAGLSYNNWNITLDDTINEHISGPDASPSEFRPRFGFELIPPLL
ncbi:hypothetical protein HD806DRAFT_493480 [Xylariaceae sp. AK1471]|nr:hypothetical protein HD806DRAFT_493480 [Xylariaceae sp. AK1471]